LTFYGGLILEKSDRIVLIDTNVVDIHLSSYIKEYEWVFLKDEEKLKFEIKTKFPFIKVF